MFLIAVLSLFSVAVASATVGSLIGNYVSRRKLALKAVAKRFEWEDNRKRYFT